MTDEIRSPRRRSTDHDMPSGQALQQEIIRHHLYSTKDIADWYGCTPSQAEFHIKKEGVIVGGVKPRMLSDHQRAYLRTCAPDELRLFEPWVLELARREGLI